MEMDTLENKKIAVIGAGHMGSAIIKGLINSHKIKRSNIFVSNGQDNIAVSKKADYIFIAVKPFIVKQVLTEIKSFIENKIIISVAVGVSLEKLIDFSNKRQKIIRVMPNILVALNRGVIGFCANKNVTDMEKDQVINLLSMLGKVVVVDSEEGLDVLTLIPGCGLAVSAYFIDLISNYAIRKGFSQSESIDMALKIFDGTIYYLKENNLKPRELIKAIATKGGITEEIINDLNKNKIEKLFEEAMEKGFDKIKLLKKRIE